MSNGMASFIPFRFFVSFKLKEIKIHEQITKNGLKNINSVFILHINAIYYLYIYKALITNLWLLHKLTLWASVSPGMALLLRASGAKLFCLRTWIPLLIDKWCSKLVIFKWHNKSSTVKTLRTRPSTRASKNVSLK